MKVYLAQHGEAASKDVDPERRLTEKGRLDVVRLAGFLKPAGLNCAAMCHSGKARAEQTAELLAPAFNGFDKIEVKTGIAPLDPVAPVAAELNSSNRDTVLVGHMPFMGKLVSHMVVGDENMGVVDYKPGSMVCLEKDEEGKWRIAWMIRPELV